MKRSSAKLLQAAIAVLGIAVFVFLLGEPTVEGRNAHATLFQIYFNDPFLAIAYGASIPFFIALYQAFKLFGEAGRGDGFSLSSLSALRTIRYCALIIIGFIMAGEAYLFLVIRGTDDIAGGVAMGIFVAVLCAVTAAATISFERSLRTRSLT